MRKLKWVDCDEISNQFDGKRIIWKLTSLRFKIYFGFIYKNKNHDNRYSLFFIDRTGGSNIELMNQFNDVESAKLFIENKILETYPDYKILTDKHLNLL